MSTPNFDKGEFTEYSHQLDTLMNKVNNNHDTHVIALRGRLSSAIETWKIDLALLPDINKMSMEEITKMTDRYLSILDVGEALLTKHPALIPNPPASHQTMS